MVSLRVSNGWVRQTVRVLPRERSRRLTRRPRVTTGRKTSPGFQSVGFFRRSGRYGVPRTPDNTSGKGKCHSWSDNRSSDLSVSTQVSVSWTFALSPFLLGQKGKRQGVLSERETVQNKIRLFPRLRSEIKTLRQTSRPRSSFI